MLSIYITQCTPKTADLDHNYQLILCHYKQASEQSCDICVFPELITTGYSCEDLFLNTQFIQDTHHYIQQIINETSHTILLLPTVYQKDNVLYNVVLVIQNKKIITVSYKHNLPNYGIFDESRYFQTGNNASFACNGQTVLVPICRDFLNPIDPISNKPDIIIVPNASVFHMNKMEQRMDIVKQRYSEIQIPMIYCNAVYEQDGILFDGQSFIFNHGKVEYMFPPFHEHVFVYKTNRNEIQDVVFYSYYEQMYSALVFGIRQYLNQNQFENVFIGLSGGIDSALVTTLTVDAVGPERVHTVLMNSPYTSNNSIFDALEIAKTLEVSYKRINISKILQSFIYVNMTKLAYQNTQARIRGTVLMGLANSEPNKSIVFSTGNKSEIAVGYCTIYGDMCGAYNPIKDIYKTDVYQLCKYRNSHVPSLIDTYCKLLNVIPQQIIQKEPSAELDFEQKDIDNLPPYSLLDSILHEHIEDDKSFEELKHKYDPETLNNVLRLVKNNEFKRRQSSPGIKISSRNFEKERRMPINLKN